MDPFALQPKARRKSTDQLPELVGCSALVVDGDNTSRSVLVTQLREFGFTEVVAVSRVQHAREAMERRRFDAIFCAQYFGADAPTGQDLLDDLQRDALLPMATVFIMVTTEASYAKVEQAAESALDAYVLKPHSAASLLLRLLAARRRKLALADVFTLLDQQQLDQAVALCQNLYQAGGPYALYCARLAAELLLRSGQTELAMQIYREVAQTHDQAWAEAGIARALLHQAQLGPAIECLQALILKAPDFPDAYDLLGRAQIKAGHLEEAMASYGHANQLTPASVARSQRLGMLAYYLGDAAQAETLLEQATRLGQDSRSYDFQTLALLCLLRADQGNGPGVLRCRDMAQYLVRRWPDNPRLLRFAKLIDGLAAFWQHDRELALSQAKALCELTTTEDFDFDLACCLLGFLAMLADDGLSFEAGRQAVNTLGMRYCTGDATFALMRQALKRYPAYAQMVEQCNEQLLQMSEQAMQQHLESHTPAAVEKFLSLAETHLNARLYEAAHQLFTRHVDKFSDSATTEQRLRELSQRIGLAQARPGYGDSQRRPPAGVALRMTTPLPEHFHNW